MNNCPTCYQATIATCVGQITVQGEFAPGPHTITVTDMFGNVFVTSETAQNGTINIFADEFPPYLFNSFGGLFTIQFYSNGNCNPADFKLCGTAYKCIQFKVVEVVGDDGSNHHAQIPCCAPGNTGGGGNTTQSNGNNPPPNDKPEEKPPGGTAYGGL